MNILPQGWSRGLGLGLYAMSELYVTEVNTRRDPHFQYFRVRELHLGSHGRTKGSSSYEKSTWLARIF